MCCWRKTPTDRQTDWRLPKVLWKGTSCITVKLKIMAVFWHVISRDGEGNHHHFYCNTSCCVFKKAVEKKEIMPTHSTVEELSKKRGTRIAWGSSSMTCQPLHCSGDAWKTEHKTETKVCTRSYGCTSRKPSLQAVNVWPPCHSLQL